MWMNCISKKYISPLWQMALWKFNLCMNCIAFGRLRDSDFSIPASSPLHAHEKSLILQNLADWKQQNFLVPSSERIINWWGKYFFISLDVLHWDNAYLKSSGSALGFSGHYFSSVNAKPNVKFLRGMHYLIVLKILPFLSNLDYYAPFTPSHSRKVPFDHIFGLE